MSTQLFKLSNRIGRLHGWRILVVFGVMWIIFAAKMTALLGWSKNTRNALLVIGALFTIGALGMVLSDWIHRRRARQAALGLPSRIPAWLFEKRGTQLKPFLGGLIGMIFIPTVFVLIAPMFYHDWASLWWPSAQGRSLGVSVEKGYDCYDVDVVMSYTDPVTGKAQCEKLSASGTAKVSSSSEAQGLARRFAPSTTHTVYVDPSQPARATVHRGPSLGTMIGSVTLPVFSALFFVVSVMTVWKSLPRRKPIDWEDGAFGIDNEVNDAATDPEREERGVLPPFPAEDGRCLAK